MANRFWVGGTASWDGIAGTKWSTTSGGTGGEADPTVSDDVYIDANSGAVTITVANTRVCQNLNLSGFTGTLAGSAQISVYGSMLLSSSYTHTLTGNILFRATSGIQTVTTAGVSVAGSLNFNGIGGEWRLQDDLTVTGTITLTNGTLDFNNRNVTANALSSNATSVRTWKLGSGLITLTGSSLNKVNFATTTNFTFDAGTSTIKLTGSISADRNFLGGGLTFYDYWNATTGSFAVIITGSNTFNNFTIDPGRTQTFTAGTTQTINGTFSALGTVGSPIVINSSGAAFTLSKFSGIVGATYSTISNSAAVGGANWRAFTTQGNVDGGGNSGWDFTEEDWTKVSKPSNASYTNVNPVGKEQYDQSNILYDDPSIFYDGANFGAYTSVGKPTGTAYTSVAKPTS